MIQMTVGPWPRPATGWFKSTTRGTSLDRCFDVWWWEKALLRTRRAHDVRQLRLDNPAPGCWRPGRHVRGSIFRRHSVIGDVFAIVGSGTGPEPGCGVPLVFNHGWGQRRAP